MRPVRLELEGFAAFRERNVVDFTGAEYFALVGPTGAGKSTVIDALTFALYGTVPRWDDRRAVALGLAPSVNRGVVRLVFDVRDDRYVAVRELRRSARGGVNVKNARLERLLDRDDVDGDTEPLATDSGVTKAVEQLLGLSFEHFTSCVVLPQGDFAEFLHAKPGDRQAILTRLLGLGVYERIAREANREASAAGDRAALLADQLSAYADATDDAVAEAGERVAALEALTEHVATLLPEVSAAAESLDSADTAVATLHAEQARLTALAPPAGLEALENRRREADDHVRLARARFRDAEAADDAVRALLAAAPERGPLERVRRDHTDLASALAARPAAVEALATARSAEEKAARRAEEAEAAATAAAAARESAAAALTAARTTLSRLADERALLTACAPARRVGGRGAPAGGGCGGAGGGPRSGWRKRRRRTRRRASGWPRLRSAGRSSRSGATTSPSRPSRLPNRTPTRGSPRPERARAEAVDGVTSARTALATALGRRDAAVRGDLAAALRPSLVVGEPCPVCTQHVPALPPPLPGVGRGGTRGGGRAGAGRAGRCARCRGGRGGGAAPGDGGARQAGRGGSAAARCGGRGGAGLRRFLVASRDGRGRRRRGPRRCLGGHPRNAARQRRGGDGRAGGAGRARCCGRRGRRRGSGGAPDARPGRCARPRRSSASSLRRRARCEPPAIRSCRWARRRTADDPLAGWSALVEWAARARAEREAALPDAQRAAATAAATADDAVRAADAADAEVVVRRREATAAARAEQQARGRVEALDERVSVLRAALAGAPSPEQVDADLARRDELEASARDRGCRPAPRESGPRGGGRCRRRRPARGGVGLGGAAWRPRPTRRARCAGGARRRSRGGLVRSRVLGAAGGSGAGRPASGGGGRRGVRPQHQRAVHSRLGAALAAEGVAVSGASPAVDARLAGGDGASLDAAGEIPAVTGEAAVAAVASALAHAEAVRARLTERRAEAAAKRAGQAEAEEMQHVARMLGGLLRSDRFPRWLVASALDTLVADASAGLAELSGGQFELTHDEGEFLVVDHADADARRPVKTLSGGETFQASLALALALSAQMSTLAAEGAARLDSIFLDEGFGTLDEANLDVVASTLENLAGRGDRMVGVITHVQGLAERVPVRFAVRRDQRSARIEREGG